MARPPDKEPTKPSDAPADPRPGRVEVDARGRNVWRWNKQEGDSTSVLLQRLDNHDLALEPTRKVPVVKKATTAGASPSPNAKAAPVAGRAPAKPSARGDHSTATKAPQHPTSPFARERDKGNKGGGFDPYNSR